MGKSIATLDICAMHNILDVEQGFLFMPSLGVSSLDLSRVVQTTRFFSRGIRAGTIA
jgi:hypothetical protein